MINYLYYRIYKYYDRKSLGIPVIYGAIFSGGLIALNIIVLNSFLAKLNFVPYLFSNHLAGIFGIFCAFIAFLYYGKNKRDELITKYSTETNKQKLKRTIIIIVYATLSIILIFTIAFFKPGYLPKLN
jgi:predicted histidine transporter YuiF (NhaC family)